MDQAHANLAEKYQEVFATPAGEEVLFHLMESCGLLTEVSINDPLAVMYAKGRRSAVLDILRRLDTDVKWLRRRLKQVAEERQQEEFLDEEI